MFDPWVEAWRKKVARGEVTAVRYLTTLLAAFNVWRIDWKVAGLLRAIVSNGEGVCPWQMPPFAHKVRS
jgi:hypothetical protein